MTLQTAQCAATERCDIQISIDLVCTSCTFLIGLIVNLVCNLETERYDLALAVLEPHGYTPFTIRYPIFICGIGIGMYASHLALAPRLLLILDTRLHALQSGLRRFASAC